MPSPELLARAQALDPGAGLPPDPMGQDTCHLDVVDREGNMVSATPSGGWLHGSPVVPGLGFPLSTRSQMFWLEEGLASSLAGGRRPRTTLTPTLVLREGRPWLACGTPGGDQQDQWSLIFFLRRLHHDFDLQSAIEVPAFHTTHFHSSFYPRAAGLRQVHLEGRFSAEVIADLRGRGHDVRVHPDWSLGRVCAVEKGEDGQLRAGADPRQGQAYAAGR
jgi:gamma-glutamyltranspeptidase/glutathione hydrolase